MLVWYHAAPEAMLHDCKAMLHGHKVVLHGCTACCLGCTALALVVACSVAWHYTAIELVWCSGAQLHKQLELVQFQPPAQLWAVCIVSALNTVMHI